MELPPLFIEQMRSLLGRECDDLIRAVEGAPPSVAVRLNPLRPYRGKAALPQVPWCEPGHYCPGERPAFTFDPMLHGGAYYVQDASSMFIHHVIKSLIDAPVRYLDLCAAPGGKTTAALGALPQGSMVVANEIVGSRARALADNVTRWGNAHTVVTSDAPAQLGRLVHAFDVVAADVPCSGEGMMRKDAQAVEQWTPELVDQCAARQRAIVDDVWPALRPGGLFIYSTCTYNRAENEEMVDYLVRQHGAQPVTVPTVETWGIAPGIDTPHSVYRFMPHRVDGEGLFMAVLRKPDDEPSPPAKKSKKNRPTQGGKHEGDALAREWLDDTPWATTMLGDAIAAYPAAHADFVKQLCDTLHVLQAGITLATAMGRKLVPHHALALSTARREGAFATVELDYLRAIDYLRGNALALDAPRGHVVVTHQGLALGFANNLGNRANNLYPKPLRILSTHTPAQPPHLVDPIS